jgi:hypothetical protein
MKYLLFPLLGYALLCLALSCSKSDGSLDSPSAERIRLVVDVTGSGGPETRATGVVSNSADSEAKVNSLQVFVFNGDQLDGYGSSTGSLSATVSCTSGTRDIWAVVNAPSLASVSTKTALLQTVCSLAAEISNFQMVGSKSETLSKDGSVTIAVDRLAARVVLKGIRNALTNASQASAFKVLSVYLTNVAGDVDLGHSSSYTVSRWFNRRGYQSSNNLGSFTFDSVGKTIASGSSDTEAHYFYSMPNPNAGAVGGPWTPRAARLVIKAEIAGTVYDYPILLPALESNKSYEISLVTITRPGNPDNGSEPDSDGDTDEEQPVVGFDQGFQITVNPWTVVTVTEGTTI